MDGQTIINKVNEDVESLRARALKKAEEQILRSPGVSKPTSVPCRALPQDDRSSEDLSRCLEILRRPVVLKDLSAQELEKPLSLMVTSMEVGLTFEDKPGEGQFLEEIMLLLEELHSDEAMYVAVVKSGFARICRFSDGLSILEIFSEEMGFGFLRAAIDLVLTESSNSTVRNSPWPVFLGLSFTSPSMVRWHHGMEGSHYIDDCQSGLYLSCMTDVELRSFQRTSRRDLLRCDPATSPLRFEVAPRANVL
jgi:hypothetical protein